VTRDWRASGKDPDGNARSALSRPARSSAPRPRPPAAPCSTRRQWARALSWVAVVTSAAVLLVAGAGYLFVNHYDANIDRIPGLLAKDGETPVEAWQPQNFLLVGSDSRDGLVGEDAFQGTGDEFITGQRSDTIILAHLYASTDRVQMVSFPRDAWVTIPAHIDPETRQRVEAHEGRINSAFEDGGPSLLIATVERLTGLDVDHYVQVDFTGFKTMVDRLGGVEVCLSEPAKEVRSGIDLPAGRQVVKGDQALAFVRQRQGLARGDVDRIGRQQQFIGSMANKVLSAGTLLNPVRLNGFLDAATSSLSVDEGLDLAALRRIALRVSRFRADDVVFTTAPIADLNATRGGASVVLLDEQAGSELYRQLRSDVVPPPIPAGEPLTVPPDRVLVEVVNAAGVDGLGRRATADLQEIGFLLTGAPRAEAGTEVATTVLHGPERAEAARTLAAALPGAQVRVDPSRGRAMRVRVGSSYDGAREVVVGAPTEAEGRTAAQDPCA
jgi:LCP family protein required for cell wall assembly